MPITALQKESRQKRIGSSDMAAILGLDPRRTPYDVWLEKTGKLLEQPVNDAMLAGTYFEDGVLDYASRELGKIVRNQFRVAKDIGAPLGSNIDALLVETGEPIEAKTAGLFGPLHETWGAEYTDEVPHRVVIQAHSHIICTDKDRCFVPAFLGGRGFVMFLVPKNEVIVDVIRETANKFWNNHVLTDIPPDSTLPTAQIIKRIRRQPESVVPIDYACVKAWQDASAAEKAAKEEKELRQAEMLAALGQAEAGECDEGLLTYFEHTRTNLDAKGLKAAYPEIFAEFSNTSKFRKVHFRQSKKQ